MRSMTWITPFSASTSAMVTVASLTFTPSAWPCGGEPLDEVEQIADRGHARDRPLQSAAADHDRRVGGQRRDQPCDLARERFAVDALGGAQHDRLGAMFVHRARDFGGWRVGAEEHQSRVVQREGERRQVQAEHVLLA
jgi:hypothetical protein